MGHKEKNMLLLFGERATSREIHCVVLIWFNFVGKFYTSKQKRGPEEGLNTNKIESKFAWLFKKNPRRSEHFVVVFLSIEIGSREWKQMGNGRRWGTQKIQKKLMRRRCSSPMSI
jgi:hypothetical protein